MTIQVRSNDPVADAKVSEAVKEEQKSALEAKASEQKQPSESETEEKEAKEEVEDESGDLEADEAEGKQDDSDKEKPRKKGGFHRRIDKLNARVAERERELEYWKSVATKGAVEPKKEQVDSKPLASVEGKPNPEKFDTHAEYVEALTEWKVEQKQKEREDKLEKSKLEAEQANVFKAHADRVKSFSEKTKDFDEVLAEVEDVPLSPTIQELIVSSENGPALMYELAKNRAEFERICKLSPLAAARELGKIESKLDANASDEKNPEPKKLTKAPKPLEPVGTGSKGTIHKSIFDQSLSQADYERLRMEQMKRRQA